MKTFNYASILACDVGHEVWYLLRLSRRVRLLAREELRKEMKSELDLLEICRFTE
jgi:hypothetical protein